MDPNKCTFITSFSSERDQWMRSKCINIHDPQSRVKVQVKRRADKINVDGLRSFMALLGEQDVGIFVSTGGFTSDAQSEARTKETRKLTLIDLEKLVELWIEHYGKVTESDKRLLPLKPIHYLSPVD